MNPILQILLGIFLISLIVTLLRAAAYFKEACKPADVKEREAKARKTAQIDRDVEIFRQHFGRNRKP